ncbi:MAG: archease [Thermoplasmatota archaeon]
MSYEHVEHTADMAVRARGASLGEAFAEAARGTVAYMIDPGNVRAVGELRIELAAETLERLLHAFLDEILFIVQTNRFALAEFEVSLTGTSLVANVRGEAYDAERHGHLHELKAVTLHELAIDRAECEVFVVLDV